jgi:hypothetical protein
MDWILPIITCLGGAILVPILTHIINWYQAKRGGDNIAQSTDNVQNIAVHDQALKIYQDIVLGLRADLLKLESANDLVEKAYMSEREKNAILRTIIMNLPCQKPEPTCDKGFKMPPT